MKIKSIVIAYITLAAGLAQAQLPTGVTMQTFYNTNQVSFTGDRTIWMGEVPSLPMHFWVLDQGGYIYSLYPTNGNTDSDATYGSNSKRTLANFSNRTKLVLNAECGAYGIAFHNDFPTDPRFYVIYLNGSGGSRCQGDITVEEWTASGAQLDNLQMERIIIQYAHNPSYGTSNLAMGPDGYLYISTNDYRTDSRALNTLGRKISRIDIDNQDPGLQYAIPSDNPFVNNGNARDEIWAYGFRNAWNLYFDPLTDDLWVAEVDQSSREEINIVTRGDNYGWAAGGDGEGAAYTGFSGFCADANGNLAPGGCSNYTDPLYALDRAGNDRAGCISIGVTYTANQASPFYGYHIFNDIYWDAIYAGKVGEPVQVVGNSNVNGIFNSGTDHNGVVKMTTDAYGRIYAVALSWGSTTHEIYRLSHPDLGPGITPIKYRDFAFKHPGSQIVYNSGDGLFKLQAGVRYYRPNGTAMTAKDLNSYSGLMIQLLPQKN